MGIGRALLKIFVLLLILVGLAGGSAGVVALRRKRILQERNRRFFQKNINRGICEISYAIYQILQDAKEAGVLQEIPEQNDDRELPDRQKRIFVDGRGRVYGSCGTGGAGNVRTGSADETGTGAVLSVL